MNFNEFGFYNKYINHILSDDCNDAIFNKIAALINKPALFIDEDGIHGKGHTIRVLKLLSLIACLEDLNDNEKTILAYAGLYHDIGRTNDYDDLSHGKDSYNKLVATGLLNTIRLKQEDHKILRYIIENHCIPDNQGKESVVNYKIKDTEKALKLYYIFKDSDGLDRVRLGDLDERFLRLKSSKKLIPIAEYLFFESDIDLI